MTPSTPKLLQRATGAILDLVFPPRCVACGKEGAFLCQACVASAPLIPQPSCVRCARPVRAAGLCEVCQAEPSSLEGVLSPFAMDDVVRQAVYALKYHNLRALAPTLGALMAAHVQQAGVTADVLVPVPLHPHRWRERGYNQAELLAKEIGRRLSLPVAPHGLARVKHSDPQARAASREERRANVEDAFLAKASFLGQRVLLVDDVCTTGATLESCAASMLQAGAARVWGVTLAKEM